MVKKFVKTPSLTTKLPSSAFTVPVPKGFARTMLARSPTNQGITQRDKKIIRLNNRAVPLNPLAPPFKPRAGNFGTKRLAGF